MFGGILVEGFTDRNIDLQTVNGISDKKGLRQCAKLNDLGGHHYYYCDCSGGKTKSNPTL